MSLTDLRSELDVKVNRQPGTEGEEEGDRQQLTASASVGLVTAQPSTVSVGTSPLTSTTSLGTPARREAAAAPPPITPSTRIMALNMIGELLRKAGVSEGGGQ